MKKEENIVSKSLYKIELYLIKIIPFIIALLYFINTILSFFNDEPLILSYVGGMSILPWLFLYISSFVFKFCIYHRLPLYYVLISDAITYYDTFIGIPIENKTLLVTHIAIFGITVLTCTYLKFRSHERRNS